MAASKPSAYRSAKSSRSGQKTTANASILNFFSRVSPPEDSLFVGGPAVTLAVPPEGVRDVPPGGDVCYPRFNELPASVKRRRTGEMPSMEFQSEGIVLDEATSRTVSRVPIPRSTPKVPLAPARRKGPFRTDSDNDDDEEPSPTKVARPVTAAGTSIPEHLPQPTAVSDSRPSTVGVGHPAGLGGCMSAKEECLHETLDESNCGEENRRKRSTSLEAFAEVMEPARAAAAAPEPAPEVDAVSGTSGNVHASAPAEQGCQSPKCCPVCGCDLGRATTSEATVHVNSCLDGTASSLGPSPVGLGLVPASTERASSTSKDMSCISPTASRRVAKRSSGARPGQPNPIVLDSDVSVSGQSGDSAFARLMSGHAEDSVWASASAAEQASRGKQAHERTCPFYKIMPGFSICVDAFRYGAVAGCNAYFLSHFHSDHYIGLTASWSHGPIYCSRVTGALVKSQLRTAAQHVVELEFEVPFIVPGTGGVSVTMIPANHCPGSSMFLFEKAVGRGRGGSAKAHRILHCGDFRACPAHVDHPRLRPVVVDGISGNLASQKIDVCYLDTTYLNPRYSFPPQDDVIRACADLCVALDRALRDGDDTVWDNVLGRREGTSSSFNVSRFFSGGEKGGSGVDAMSNGAGIGCLERAPLAAPDPRTRLLVVCGTYSIGKERICSAIARALRTKIFAPPAKMRLISQLGDAQLASLMTSKPFEAQVHMQSLAEIRPETLAEYLASHRAFFGRIVGFRPSGWNYRPVGTAVNAAVQPWSLSTSSLLHGGAWRPTCTSDSLVPQRGSCREAVCFGVPYSEHSSFRELAMFLMSLDIQRVVPTVNVGSEASRRRMKGWTDRWLAERSRGGLVRAMGADEGPGKGVELWDGKNGQGGAARW